MPAFSHYLRVLATHKHPLRFLAARALVQTEFCRWLTIPQNGYRLRFYPTNLSEQLWVDPGCREPELRLIRAYLRPGDHVIDVGANVGDTALTAAVKVGAHGCVWAIEAHPRTFAFLRGNIVFNRRQGRNISALNAIAASEPGHLRLSDNRHDDMNRVGVAGVVAGVEVDAERLDDLVPYGGQVDLLKIDVEGYENPSLGWCAQDADPHPLHPVRGQSEAPKSFRVQSRFCSHIVGRQRIRTVPADRGDPSHSNRSEFSDRKGRRGEPYCHA